MSKNKISTLSKRMTIATTAIASFGVAGALDAIIVDHSAHAAHITFDLSKSNMFVVNGRQEYAFLHANGSLAFCIEPFSYLKNGSFPSLAPSSSRLSSSTLRDIEQIAFWGYYNTAQTKSDYVTAQAMIWERVNGGTFNVSATVPDYSSRKAQIKDKIRAYKLRFSHLAETHKVVLGDTLELHDDNNWLSLVGAEPIQVPGWNLSVNGDTFSATPTDAAEAVDVHFTASKMESYTGTSIVYSSNEKIASEVPGQMKDLQDLAVLRVYRSDPSIVHLKPIKFVSIHTEKSVSAINRLITDEEYRAATDGRGDLSETTYALYKDGQPVKWSDETSVRQETHVTKGTKVEGDEIKVKADRSGEVQIDDLLREGDYELREISGPYDTLMDTSPSVIFSKAEADAMGGKSPLIMKVNDEENKSTNNANGVVNALKPRMHIATEKSVSSYGRMITDDEARSHGADVSQAVFELYQNGHPVRWSDSSVIDDRSNVTYGTKVEGSDTVKIKADNDGKVGIEKIFEGDYEFREVTSPDETRMDLTPTVKFTAAEARKKAIETDTVQNVKIEKFNDEERPDSEASSQGVVNTLIQRAEVKTEKSISANGRLLTDDEAKEAGTNVNQTIFELYKNGKAVEWSDKSTVDARTSITTGTKVDDTSTVQVKADDNGEVSIKGVIIDANDTDVFTWKEVHNPEDTYLSQKDHVDFSAEEVKAKALAENIIQNAKIEKLNNEEQRSTEDAQGVVNALHEFEFEVQKTFTMTGTTREGMTATVGTDEQFSSSAYEELLKIGKFKYSDVQVELRYADGTPVQWTDAVSYTHLTLPTTERV